MGEVIATREALSLIHISALRFTNGQNLLQLKDYTVFGQGNLGPIPMPVVFMIIITIITWYIMTHTRFGRSLYAIGGNEGAAIASGINVKRNKYIIYIINGIFAGIAGVLFMSRVNAVSYTHLLSEALVFSQFRRWEDSTATYCSCLLYTSRCV